MLKQVLSVTSSFARQSRVTVRCGAVLSKAPLASIVGRRGLASSSGDDSSSGSSDDELAGWRGGRLGWRSVEKHLSEQMRIPAPQSAAPHFAGKAVVEGQFKDVTLTDYEGKWLVLFFYPLDFTFVCPTEIVAFSDAQPQFAAVNAEVVACSTDSHFSHLAWTNTSRKEGGLGPMKIAMLADYKKEIAYNYGVLHMQLGVALRGLFVIDPKGVVRHVTVNDLPVGRSVDEALRVVKAFQFVEQHGEVCPANWQPQTPTIKPNPTASKEYFEKVN